MKKIITVISFILFLFSLLLFAFNFAFQKFSYDMVMNDHQEVNIIPNDERSQDEFLDAIQQFSKKHHVNISQYTFLDDETMHIYSTNLEDDPNIDLVDGTFPEENEFIANNFNYENNQSGMISTPPSQLDLKFHNMDQVINVGLQDILYISSSNQDINTELEKVLSPFGHIEFVNNELSPFYFVDLTLLLIVFFTFINFSIVSIFYIFSEKKLIYIYQLWGYSFKEIFKGLMKPFFKVASYILGSCIIALTIFIFYFKQYHYVYIYIGLFFIVVIIVMSIGFLIAFLMIRMILRLGISSVNLKGKLPFKNYAIASVMAKFIITSILLSVNIFSVTSLLDLNKQLESNEYWNITEGLYRINVHIPDNVMNNLSADRQINNKLSDFYDELNEKKSAILIDSVNFLNIDLGINDSIYAYELDTEESGSNPHTSIDGRNVTINENYLDFNPIYTIDGENAKDKINYDSETLSLLVPEKLRDYEEEIKHNFLDFFYFQKVEVDNIYNEEIGLPLNSISIDDLDIQIIYVENNQDYFTLNSNSGDLNNNLVTDPIAVIYQPTMDTSFISAHVTTNLYYYDNSESAYSSISNVLNDTDTLGYIPSVSSVFQEKGQEIAEAKQLMYQQIITLIFMLILSFLCIIIFTWCYYAPNIYKLYIEYLFGYSHWFSNKYLYLTMFITNIISGIAVYIIFSSIITIYSIVVLLLIDMITIMLVGKIIQQKNSSTILKGD
ncbi:DUF1430 domain-containing protein [Oceanobacillus sp. J11TS1]|uniref:DUF1430 domain-containing protein n=1 Tax=Oceanobacillus sp. J11TS1 TaxID=2807191 RepID=UPI001B1EC839|nr:DUF1430 domain-containing protein [Oceanobacillus sp. J11TS1]GIO25048.1 hypothetical protein J11TS1_36290 [Oceanobacillus sp. J11TS1]